MKWFSIASFCAFVVLTTACEKHPASQLPPEFLGEAKHPEAKHKAEPAVVPPEAAKSDASKPPGEAKPGEAPKFFPETK